MEKCVHWIQSTSNNARKIKSVKSICDSIYVCACVDVCERESAHICSHIYVCLFEMEFTKMNIRNACAKINENQKHKLHIQLRFI